MAKRNGFFACIYIKNISSLNIFPYLQKMSLIWRYFKSQCIFLKLEWVHIKTKKKPSSNDDLALIIYEKEYSKVFYD